MITKNDKFRCDDCNKFMKQPYDDYTIFGCADPGAPEPYDPVELCKSCSGKKYKELLKGYECCKRSGDWQKSNAEVRAAKKAKLVWISNDNSLVEKRTGRHIMNEYIREGTDWLYIPYLEYEQKRREETRCKCWRKKDKDGNCPTCTRAEVYCQCRYSSYDGVF